MPYSFTTDVGAMISTGNQYSSAKGKCTSVKRIGISGKSHF